MTTGDRYVAEQTGPFDWALWDTATESWVPPHEGNRDQVEAAADELNRNPR